MRSKWYYFLWGSLLPLLASAQLSGSYTIDPSGTGSNNYTSFSAAISALSTSGVSGAVTFNVKQGTYLETIIIDSIQGSSPINTVTFQSDPANTGTATIAADTASANNSLATIRLSNCWNITLKGLTITSYGTSFGRLIEYTGNVGNISIVDNTFSGVATSTSSYYAGIYYTSPAEAQGNWILSGNTMTDVSYAMYIYGTSYTTSMDTIIIEDNVISTSYYGLYPRYAKYQKVHDNTINATGTYCYNYLYYPSVGIDVQNNTINAGTGTGIYVYSAPSGGSDMFAIVENNTINAGTYGIRVGGSASSTYNHFSDVSIKKNNITLTGSTNYGIYLYAVDGDDATVENNMISSAGTGSVYGIYSYHSGGVAYKHNTVNVTAGSATSGRACYFNASTSTTYFTADSNTINNNIFVNTGGGYAFEASSSAPAGTHFSADYNNFYATSSSPFGPGSTTLSAWQTASSQDANSVWGDPLFVSATDLHVQGSAANNAGTPVGVATDIDGDTRSTTTPDIGADEYAPLTCFGVSALGSANVSDVSFEATWSSNNSTTIGSQVRYRETGTTGTYTVMSGSTGTATVSGLMASTSYDYSVREICSVGDTCSWSADATVTTAACDLSNQCQYTVYMVDSYGDGWNGNAISFAQSGNVVGTMTLGSGLDSGMATIGLCSWDSVTVGVAALGSYTYEVGFIVVNAMGDTVLVRNFGPSSTASFNSTEIFGSFLPECSACPQVSQCLYTVNMTDSYGDGWTGNTIALIQNGHSRIVGNGFTTGSNSSQSILLCDSIPVLVQVGSMGYAPEDVGFEILNQNGVTVFSHSSGNTYSSSTQFGSFTPDCTPIICPQVQITTDSLVNGVHIPCVGGTTNISVNVSESERPYSILWSTLDTTAALNSVSAGTYFVEIYDNVGCSVKDTVTLTASTTSSLTANISVQTSTVNGYDIPCHGGQTATLNAIATGGNSPYTFNWDSGSTNALRQNIGAGTYSVTIMDANGCVASAQKTLNQPTQLIALGQVVSDFGGYGIACNGGSNGIATVSPSGGVGPYYFLWNASIPSQQVSNLNAGSHIVRVTDANGCQVFDTITMTEPMPMSVVGTPTAIQNGYSINCFGGTGSASAVASGGTGTITYSWSHGVLGSFSGQIPVGSYYVTASDSNGCTAVDTLTLIQPTPLAATSTIVSNFNGYSISCNGASDASLVVLATGGVGNYTYAWNQGGTNDTLQGVPAGTYSVTVTDGNGCTKTVSKTVVEPLALSAVASPYTNFNFYNVSCYGAMDGKARVVATGGVGMKTYVWNTTPAQSTQIASNLVAGTYYVQVQDANGCQVWDTTSLIEPDPLAFSASVEDANCYDESNGAISVSVTGGISNTYLVNWGNGIYNPQIAGLHSGWHPFSVLDANGCGFADSVFVGQPTPLEILIDTIPATCMNSYDGEVYIMAQGGSPGYQYYLDGAQNNGHVTGLGTEGIYLKVMDSHGCDTTVYYEMPPLYEPCLFIPNVFTPNDNGENDTWKIRGFAWQTGFTLRVFNSQGAQVYFAESGTDVEWDGTVNGIPAPMGDYYYILESVSSNETYYGTVTILR